MVDVVNSLTRSWMTADTQTRSGLITIIANWMTTGTNNIELRGFPNGSNG